LSFVKVDIRLVSEGKDKVGDAKCIRVSWTSKKKKKKKKGGRHQCNDSGDEEPSLTEVMVDLSMLDHLNLKSLPCNPLRDGKKKQKKRYNHKNKSTPSVYMKKEKHR
jgi:hypothetical protein